MVEKNLTNEEYHKSPRISASGLKVICSTSVYHYLHTKIEKTDAMVFGSAVHSYILEKDKFYDEFAVIPKIDKRTKAGKEEYAKMIESVGKKEVITDLQMRWIQRMEANVLRDELAKYLINGEVEKSFFSEIDGIEVRIRPDAMIREEGIIMDIKTCRNNDEASFRSDVRFRYYDLQAYVYCLVMGYDPRKFRFIALETKAPFSCQVYSLSDQTIERGKKRFEKALNDWKFYLMTGKATGYTSENVNEDGSIIL